MAQSIDWVDAAIERYLAAKLADFRIVLENGTGKSIQNLDLNVALLLADLCKVFGLGEGECRHVLGEDGLTYVIEVMNTHIFPCELALP